MYKNLTYRETYAAPDSANVRYPSSAAKSIDGWAYVNTKDGAYLYGLAQYHTVEIWDGYGWVPYRGQVPPSRTESEAESAWLEDDRDNDAY